MDFCIVVELIDDANRKLFHQMSQHRQWHNLELGAPGQKCKDSPPRAPSPFHSLLTSPPICDCPSPILPSIPSHTLLRF